MENPFYIDPVEEFERMARFTSKQQERTTRAKKLFLEQYRLTHGNVRRSCELAGISREIFYVWRKKDPYFREVLPLIAFDYANEDARGSLMDLIRQGHPASVFKFLKKHHPDFKEYKVRRLRFGVKNTRRDQFGRFTRSGED